LIPRKGNHPQLNIFQTLSIIYCESDAPYLSSCHRLAYYLFNLKPRDNRDSEQVICSVTCQDHLALRNPVRAATREVY